MTKREDTIERIERVLKLAHKESITVTIPKLTAERAVSMLKEQEAVEPRVSTAEQRCGHCNKVIEMDGWQSCPWCGKMIDWKRWWNKNGTHDNT